LSGSIESQKYFGGFDLPVEVLWIANRLFAQSMIQRTNICYSQGLVLDRVTKRYQSVVAVDHVSLEIEKREFIAIVGPTGCGKTTLLRLIAGVEKPDDGHIYIQGKCMDDVNPSRQNPKIGRIIDFGRQYNSNGSRMHPCCQHNGSALDRNPDSGTGKKNFIFALEPSDYVLNIEPRCRIHTPDYPPQNSLWQSRGGCRHPLQSSRQG
jgi:hypothetical protein